MTGYRHTAQALQKPAPAKGDPAVLLTTECGFDRRIVSSKRPFGKIFLPSNVIGIGLTTDFYMTNYSYRGHIDQTDDVSPTFLCFFGCKEAPFAVTNGPKITVSYPMGLFVLVPSFSPPPEVFEDAIVNVAKGLLGTRVAMVVGPTPDHRVKHS